MATLTINFTNPSPLPNFGYKVLYRPVGGSTYTEVTPTPTQSPIIITGLSSSTNYEGTIQAMCTKYGGSNLVPFVSNFS